MENKIRIIKDDLQQGDLVKSYNDSWLVMYDEDNEKILVNTKNPSQTNSLKNYTDDLIDIRRFIRSDKYQSNCFYDILAIKKAIPFNSKNGWDYTRENEYLLNEGFEVNLINKEN